MTEPTLSFGNQREGASRYLAALREHWLLILTLVVVAVGSAAAYSYSAPKKYKAEADLLVSATERLRLRRAAGDPRVERPDQRGAHGGETRQDAPGGRACADGAAVST